MNFQITVFLILVGSIFSLGAMTETKDPTKLQKQKVVGMLRTIAREYERVTTGAVTKYSKPSVMAEEGMKTQQDIAFVVHVKAEDAPGIFEDELDDIIEGLPDQFKAMLKHVYGVLKNMISFDQSGASRAGTFNTPAEVVALVQEVARGLNAFADTLATID